MNPLWPRLDDLTPHIGEPGLPPAEAYPMRYPQAWPVMPIKNPLKDALWPTVDEPKGIPRDQEHPIGPWKEGQHRSWPGNLPAPKGKVPFDWGKHLPKHERYGYVDEIIDGVPYNQGPQESISDQFHRIQESDLRNRAPKGGKAPFGPFNPPPRNQG